MCLPLATSCALDTAIYWVKSFVQKFFLNHTPPPKFTCIIFIGGNNQKARPILKKALRD